MDASPEARKRMREEGRAKGITKSPRFQALLLGDLAVEDLTDEELLRGYPEPEKGFSRAGRPPGLIPLKVHNRMVSELFKRADDLLRANLLEAVETMTKIAQDTDLEPKDRIKAATWVYERVRGKMPDIVQHTQDKPFEVVFEKMEIGKRSVSSERVSLEDYAEAEFEEEAG
jgi:hypothetical protein